MKKIIKHYPMTGRLIVTQGYWNLFQLQFKWNRYLCNPCLSPLKLWVWIPLMVRCTRYNIMW